MDSERRENRIDGMKNGKKKDKERKKCTNGGYFDSECKLS